MAIDVNNLARVSRALPQGGQDGALSYVRSGKYQEPYSLSLVPTKHLLADEGGYFTAISSPGNFDVANIYGLQTTWSATTAFCTLKNNDSLGGKRLYLDFLRVICGVVGAAATSVRIGVVIDSGNRQPTANNNSVLPSNVNMDSTIGSVATCNFFAAGIMAVPAAVSARNIGQTCLNHHLPIAGDEYVCYFGSTDPAASHPGTAAAITVAGKYTSSLPPIIVGPQQTCVIHLWEPGVTTTNPQFIPELAWWER